MNNKKYLKYQNNTSKFVLLLLVTTLFLITSINSAYAVSSVTEVSKTIEVTSRGEIRAEIVLRNDGATIPKLLVEIQPRAGTCGLGGLSWISSQSTCDSNYPHNVHKIINDFRTGETVRVILTTPPMPDGKYCVVGVSVDKCCVDSAGNPVSPACTVINPYNWGSELNWVTVDSGVPQQCGDNKCTGTENPGNCPLDCGGYCGDGYCQSSIGETADWCGDCTLGGLGDILLWLIDNWWVVLAIVLIIIGAVVMVVKR